MTDAEALQLYLLRHADAGDPEAWTGDDDDRPLTSKGKRQSERLGRFLSSNRFAPEKILTSPKARALQTAQIVARALGQRAEVDERLGSELGIGALDDLLGSHGNSRPMLVGHDPDFSTLVATLCGASRVPLKKGALARIDVQIPLQPGAGVLRWLLPPDLLKGPE